MQGELIEQDKQRKVPNLKGLREMIKKNGGTGRPSQSPHHVNLKSERTNRNDSECSFTLTDDEEHRHEGRRSSS